MNVHAIVKDYMTAWNRRDEQTLANLFHQDVTLKDWDVEVTGNSSVVGANAQIWSNIPDIHILIMHIDVCENKAFAEIAVTSDKEKLHLRVVDVITIQDNKIISVDAFKQ